MNIIYIVIGLLIIFLLIKKKKSNFGKKNNFSSKSESYSIDKPNIGNINDDTVLIFYAEWCGHCKKSMNDFKKAVAKNPKNIMLINSDEHKDLVKKYGVTGFPTIMKANGEKYTGERTADKINNFADE